MFESVEYVLRILSYFILVYLVYQTLEIGYKGHKQDKSKSKVSHLYIIVVSYVIAVWAVWNFHEGLGDHYNYAFRFENKQDTTIYLQSYGLGLIYDFLHKFTTNSDTMFIAVIFLGNYLTFWAYRIYDKATPHAMLFLMLSEFFLYNFAAIKQFVAVGFSCLFFAHFFSGKRIWCIIWIPLAIMFHEMAYLLIPVYFILLFQDNRYIRVGALCVFVLIFLLPFVFNRVISLIYRFIPVLGEQLLAFLQGSADLQGTNFATILKGAPYYLFSLMPLFHKGSSKGVVANYNGGQFLTNLCTIFVLASLFNYWYFRFSYLMMLPVFVHIDNVVDAVDSNDAIVMRHVAVLTIVGLTVKYLFQMYFTYGGI